jgi:hypothetical protein
LLKWLAALFPCAHRRTVRGDIELADDDGVVPAVEADLSAAFLAADK